MKRLLFFIGLFVSVSVFSQHSIQSSVFDSKNGLALELATVRLLKTSDSTLVQGGLTDGKGEFLFSKVKNGTYLLRITSVGYNEYRKTITIADKDLILKTIHLAENAQVLGEVKVTGTAAQLVVKGDTLEYNATAFKTAENAVVEDLIKKLPGVEISSEGKITVNGEEITKIRVDGKKFFDGDIEQATKNLPADMIDKIQVLDQKSDMAQLTGFEDGDTERIINLTTKSNRRVGVFGNVGAGGGLDVNNDFRYDSKLSLNFMTNDSQTSINGSANNLNNARSSRGRGSWSGGANGGITEAQNLALNNNTIVNPKLKIGGDMSVNHANNFSDNSSDRTTYLTDGTYNDLSHTTSGNDKYAANTRLELEWKVDSLNTFVFQPKFGYDNTDSYTRKSYSYLANNDSTSWGKSESHGINESVSGGLNVIYNHKFTSKVGRSLTVNLNTDFSQGDNDSYNISNKYGVDTVNVDQYTTKRTDKYSSKLKMSYVEPLWNLKNMVEVAASVNTANTSSEKIQRNKDINGDYTIKDDEYSNDFQNDFLRETMELNYRYTDTNYKIMLGLNGEPAQTKNFGSYGSEDRDTTYSVFNFAPTARLQYNFGKKKFARFDYRGSTNQPSIDQMQPVKNNSNLMSETVGNASLNPSFSHNMRMMYSSFNDVKFSSFSTYFNVRAEKDALVSNRIYDLSLKQYNQTINSDAIPISFMWNVMYNTPLIDKKLHFNTSTRLNYQTQYSNTSSNVDFADINLNNLMLGELSKTRSAGATEDVALTFTNDFLEIGVRGKLGYSNSLNNLKDQQTNIWDWTTKGNVVVRMPYNYTISSDIAYSDREGYSSSLDLKEIMWNASIDKNIFKNKGTISLKANDILHQQLNISQSVGDNYIQYNKYNTLPTYFLLSFTYKINQFKGNTKSNEDRPERLDGDDRPRRGDGSGPGGGGGRRPE